MAHRLLHSLVFSSVIALEAAGCNTSHMLVPPDPRDGGPPDDDDDAGPDHDASTWIPLADAGPPPTDAGPPTRDDAGPPVVDAGLDAGFDDAGPPHDLRTCEPGWPTTKAMVCEPDGAGRVICCRLPSLEPDGGMDCCVGETP